MTPEQITLVTVIAGIVFGSTGVIGAWKFFVDRKKAPLDRRQVEVATESQQVSDALAMVRESEARAARSDARAESAYQAATQAREETRAAWDGMRAAHDENVQTRKIAEDALDTARKTASILAPLGDYVEKLWEDWPTVRLNDTPPPLPQEIQHHYPRAKK